MSTLATVQEMLIDEFGLTLAQVGPDAKLGELGIDSLAALEFLFKLEDKFGLGPNTNPPLFATVAQIVGEVDRLIAAGPPPPAVSTGVHAAA